MNQEVGILRRMDQSGVPLLLARLVLGGMFVYLGALKMAAPFEFLKQIRLYKLIPDDPPILLNSIGIVLPWLEILCGAALILGTRIRAAGVLMALMLTVFTPMILRRGLQISAEKGISFFEVAFDCGCGTGVAVTWKKLLENAGLFLLAVYAAVSRARRFGDARAAHRIEPAKEETSGANSDSQRAVCTGPVTTPDLSTP